MVEVLEHIGIGYRARAGLFEDEVIGAGPAIEVIAASAPHQ